MRCHAIHAGLAPNATTRDLFLSAKLLSRPRRWRESPAPEQLTQDLSARLLGTRVFLMDSGRRALHLALQLAGVSAGDEVLLQAFTCVSVPAPVRWLGAHPRYVDIRPETYTMDPEDLARKITTRARALVLQHTFGLPADLESLLAVARRHRLVVIEDAAHALGATYHGRPVGTFGDLAVLSFGRDKVISAVFGGALLVPQRAYAEEAAARVANLPLPPNRWIFQQLLHPLLMPVLRSTYACGGQYALTALQRAHILSRALTTREKKGGEPPLLPSRLATPLATLALDQLRRLPETQAHRQDLATHYAESLAELSGLDLPVVPKDRTHAWLTFPLRVSAPAVLHRAAHRAGIVLGDWYDRVVAPRGTPLTSLGYADGSCPRAEKVSRMIVNLPTSPTTSLRDAQAILGVVRNAVGAD